MVFGIIMLVLVAAVAFYHYIQGMFSAMISCIVVILAAMIAVTYHESLAESILANVVPAQAHAAALVAIFAITYALIRFTADKLVPGNVRFSVLVDKIGAGVFGVLAGVFAVGILAIAAQMLPFGPSIGGYSRFAVTDRPQISGMKNIPRQFYNAKIGVFDELAGDRYDSASASSMFPLPLDGAVLGLTSYLSAGGSLAGTRSFGQVHPDYATELFGTRLAQPFYGGDVLYSSSGGGVTVSDVYTSKSVLTNPEDIEAKIVRGEHSMDLASEGTTPVIVRMSFGKGAGMITPSVVRLAVKGKEDSKDYYPIGSFQHGEQLLETRPDDPIRVESGKAVDFVFLVDSDRLIQTDNSELLLPSGSFLEAKRSARVDLSNKQISQSMPGGGDVGILTKSKQ